LDKIYYKENVVHLSMQHLKSSKGIIINNVICGVLV
jgi:hypothetical protein